MLLTQHKHFLIFALIESNHVKEISHMKKFLSILLIICCLLSGCSNVNNTNNRPEEAAAQTSPITFTDSLGYTVTIDNPKHVAVLSGSIADAWLLAGGKLSSTTEDSWRNDRLSLSENVSSLGSIASPNLEKMISLDTDFAILSSNISGQVDLREQLEQAGITTAYFNIETFIDYSNMMKIFTAITGRDDLYQKNVMDIKSEIDTQIARQDNSHPTILFLRSYSSGISAKDSHSMTGAMLKELGCTNIADSNTSFAGDLSMEAIIKADPDYIFVTTMGESEEAALKSLTDQFISNPAWNTLSAVKNEHYNILPKDLFQNKPNNRWAESYEQLADILYGE